MSLPHIFNAVVGAGVVAPGSGGVAGANPAVNTVTGAANNVDEGSSLTINVATTDCADGTVLNWSINHVTSSSSDFGTNSGTVTINSNAGSFTVTPTADLTTEGAETFTVTVSGTVGGTAVSSTSASITINDTSLDPPTPTYAIVKNSGNNAYEGAIYSLTVNTTNVANGTTLYMDIPGGASDISQFGNVAGLATSGSDRGFYFTINSNTWTGSFTPDPDPNEAEGTENFNLILRTGANFTGTQVASDSFSLLDATYEVSAPASINEGSSGTINVTGTNIANGRTLYWEVVTVTDDDFATETGSFTMTSNAGSFTVTPTADLSTEGSETATINIYTYSNPSGLVAQDTFTINDTSTTPVATYSVTAPASINEGSSGTMNVSTTNVSNGTTLYWTVTTPSGGDFGTSSGSFTINSNSGSFSVTPTADLTTEGSETGTIQIRTGSTSGTIVATDTFTINDTSTTPVPTYSVTAPASISEGQTGGINVSTTNVSNGTTLYWTVTPAGDFGTSSGSFTINSNAGSFTISPTADLTTEGTETGTIQIRTGSTSGTIVASDTFDILDTSTTPTPTYSVTAPASIDEGSAGTMNVSTTNVSNGTTLYWTVTPSGDFGTSSGNFTINSNAGSFTVTPTADSTTEGSETGTIEIRTGSTSGTIVATDTFTINDTSQQSATMDATFDLTGWVTNESATQSFGFPEAWCGLLFSHDPTNNRIIINRRHGNSTAPGTYVDVYCNYSGFTNITSVEVQYNVGSQSCSGSCDPVNYSWGPTPVQNGYNSGTYYSVPTTPSVRNIGWMAQRDPNPPYGQGTTFTTTTGPSGGTPEFRIKVVCDQGTFTSDASGNFQMPFLSATYGQQAAL